MEDMEEFLERLCEVLEVVYGPPQSQQHEEEEHEGHH